MRTLIVTTIALMLIPSIGSAQNMRPANGEECHPTEKTYYEEDGETPFMCKPSGGPAYSFQVYVDGEVLWNGDLPSDEPSVNFILPKQHVEGTDKEVRLLVERDLESDPSGEVVFFGETHLAGIENVSAGSSSISLPVVQANGISIHVDGGEVVTQMPKVEGAVVDFSGYRFVISPAN